MTYYIQLSTKRSIINAVISEVLLPVELPSEPRLSPSEMIKLVTKVKEGIVDVLLARSLGETLPEAFPTPGPITPFGHGLLP